MEQDLPRVSCHPSLYKLQEAADICATCIDYTHLGVIDSTKKRPQTCGASSDKGKLLHYFFQDRDYLLFKRKTITIHNHKTNEKEERKIYEARKEKITAFQMKSTFPP